MLKVNIIRDMIYKNKDRQIYNSLSLRRRLTTALLGER